MTTDRSEFRFIREPMITKFNLWLERHKSRLLTRKETYLLQSVLFFIAHKTFRNKEYLNSILLDLDDVYNEG